MNDKPRQAKPKIALSNLNQGLIGMLVLIPSGFLTGLHLLGNDMILNKGLWGFLGLDFLIISAYLTIWFASTCFAASFGRVLLTVLVNANLISDENRAILNAAQYAELIKASHEQRLAEKTEDSGDSEAG